MLIYCGDKFHLLCTHDHGWVAYKRSKAMEQVVWPLYDVNQGPHGQIIKLQNNFAPQIRVKSINSFN